MLDPDDQTHRTNPIAPRLLQALKKLTRYHWDSFGKLNDPRTHWISFSVAAGFLLIVYLLFG